jgi:hypothetical protein
LLGLGHVLESLLGELVLADVGLVEGKALLEDHDQFFVGDEVVFPKDAVIKSGASLLLGGLDSFDLLESEDVHLAVGDHLVSNLDEEASHAFVSVIVASDGVDHLDGVHEDGQSLSNSDWISVIKRLDKTLQGLEVLDVVFSLIEGLSDLELDTSPVAEGQVDSGIGLFTHVTLAYSGKDILDGSAVLVAELLTDLGEHSHAELPVLEFISGAFTSIGLLVGFSLLKGSLDLLRPFTEDRQEVGNHVWVNLRGIVDVFGILLILIIVLVEHDVAAEGLEGFLELAGELFEYHGEVVLLLSVTNTPIFSREFVNEWLVNRVHQGVELQD